MAQRLVLNLRSIGNDEKGTTQRSELVLEFAHGSIIGNIGAPLRTRPTSMDGPDYFEYDENTDENEIENEKAGVGEVVEDVRVHGVKDEENQNGVLDIVELPRAIETRGESSTSVVYCN